MDSPTIVDFSLQPEYCGAAPQMNYRLTIQIDLIPPSKWMNCSGEARCGRDTRCVVMIAEARETVRAHAVECGKVMWDLKIPIGRDQPMFGPRARGRHRAGSQAPRAMGSK